MTLIYGIGINNSDYPVSKCPFYKKWSDMLRRCYSEKFQHKQPAYKGCAVCDEWLLFSNFRDWMSCQNWKGKQLDKDLLLPGNKLYSPDRCLFVSREINNLFTGSPKGRKTGVFQCKERGKYVAYCNLYGKTKYLGRFLEEREAKEEYRKCKKAYVLEIAEKNIEDEKLYNALVSMSIRI